jgi:hypothetical protein
MSLEQVFFPPRTPFLVISRMISEISPWIFPGGEIMTQLFAGMVSGWQLYLVAVTRTALATIASVTGGHRVAA